MGAPEMQILPMAITSRQTVDVGTLVAAAVISSAEQSLRGSKIITSVLFVRETSKQRSTFSLSALLSQDLWLGNCLEWLPKATSVAMERGS